MWMRQIFTLTSNFRVDSFFFSKFLFFSHTHNRKDASRDKYFDWKMLPCEKGHLLGITFYPCFGETLIFDLFELEVKRKSDNVFAMVCYVCFGGSQKGLKGCWLLFSPNSFFWHWHFLMWFWWEIFFLRRANIALMEFIIFWNKKYFEKKNN